MAALSFLASIGPQSDNVAGALDSLKLFFVGLFFLALSYSFRSSENQFRAKRLVLIQEFKEEFPFERYTDDNFDIESAILKQRRILRRFYYHNWFVNFLGLVAVVGEIASMGAGLFGAINGIEVVESLFEPK